MLGPNILVHFFKLTFFIDKMYTKDMAFKRCRKIHKRKFCKVWNWRDEARDMAEKLDCKRQQPATKR